MLVVDGIHKRFGSTQALRRASLRVEGGEVLAVLGENGAGKSTLMQVLAGALPPDGGGMTLRGAPYAPASPEAARAAGVVMVHQEPALCPDLTVADNVVLGVEPARLGWLDRRDITRRAAEALRGVAGEAHAERIGLDTPVRALGPGDRQLVAIARAVALVERADRGGVLILDEPTSSLAQGDVDRLFTAVDNLRGAGLAILYISHFLEEVQRVADRYTVLRDGESVGGGLVAEASKGEIVAQMVGRQVEDLFPRSAHTLGAVLLEVSELWGRKKPRGASLRLCRGEVLGVAGLVGSGRTELLRAIFGLDRVVRGEVKVASYAGPASPRAWLSLGMGMLSEDRKEEGLALSMSVAENLTLGRLSGLGPLGLVLPSRQRAVAEKWVERLRVRCRDVDQPAGALSGGNQQKLALARLLYQEIDVALLDEPTRGVDVGSRADVYRLIDALACDGKAVLVVSSYLPELLGICDRVAVMRRGELMPARPVAERDEHELLMEATGA